MSDILIRNVPTDQLTQIDALASALGISRQEFLAGLITQTATGFDPGIVIGYVQLHNGELDDDADCPECGQPVTSQGTWLGYTADLRPFGPVCGICATTE